MEKKLAVIILNWNGIAYTKKCVQSLLDSSKRAMDIFILDNGSEKNEAEDLRILYRDVASSIVIERSERNLGFSGGNNRMVQRALEQRAYPYILLLNQDAVVEKDTLEKMCAYMDAHTDVAVCGPMVLRENDKIESVGGKINFWNGKITSLHQNVPRSAAPSQPTEVDCVIGNCFLVRSSAWGKIGALDEQFFAYYEEADWCIRARRAGYRCIVVPSAVARHAKSGGFRTYLVTRNMIWFEKKNASPAQQLIFFFRFWLQYIPERIKKDSLVRDLFRAAFHGFFNLHRGQFS